jgi:hypothetical protein
MTLSFTISIPLILSKDHPFLLYSMIEAAAFLYQLSFRNARARRVRANDQNHPPQPQRSNLLKITTDRDAEQEQLCSNALAEVRWIFCLASHYQYYL